jgi:hypothetical protein
VLPYNGETKANTNALDFRFFIAKTFILKERFGSRRIRIASKSFVLLVTHFSSLR